MFPIVRVTLALCLFTASTAALAEGLAEGMAYEGRYVGHQIVEVEVQTAEQLNALLAGEAEILNCVPHIGTLRIAVGPQQLLQIEKMGLETKVLFNDLQALVEAERGGANNAARGAGDPFADFFLDYHEYDNGVGSIVWYLNELETRNPGLAEVISVGTTLEGRTIWGVRITNQAITTNKPGLVLFGCEHAREWVASTIPSYFGTNLLADYGIDPETTSIVDNTEVYIIPVMNVDGFLYTWSTNRLWRKNRRDNGDGSFGVDLNRNWAEGWGGEGSDGIGSSEIFRGPAPFSEPESQAMRDFFIAHPNVKAQLDIHSYSQLILWPYGFTATLPPDQPTYSVVGLAMQSEIASVHGLTYTAGPIYTTIYPASGGSLDWTYAQRDILSYSYECRDTGSFGFELPASEIIPNNQELHLANMHLAQWVAAQVDLSITESTQIPTVIPPSTPQALTVDIVSIGENIVPGSGLLHYRYDGGTFVTTPLINVVGSQYEGTLPGADCNDVPEFYFSAEGSISGTVFLPETAPTATYLATVGDLELAFVDSFEADMGWVVQDDVGLTDGTWDRGAPVGGGDRGDPANDFDGSGQCYLTDNLDGNSDVDGGATSLVSPVVDLSGADAVISYALWYTNNNGGDPNNDVFKVFVSNNDGTDWLEVAVSGPTTQAGWTQESFLVSDFVIPTSQVRVGFEASDFGAGSVVEAGIDAFIASRLTCTAAPAPQIVSARSVVDHGGTPIALDLALPSIEPRALGVSRLEVSFDQAMDASTAENAANVSIVGVNNPSPPVTPTLSLDVGGTNLTILLSAALPDGDSYAVNLTGMTAAGVDLDPSASSFAVRAILGDVNQDGTTSTGDASIIKPHFGEAADVTNALFDFNADGIISTGDASGIKPLFGNTAPAAP